MKKLLTIALTAVLGLSAFTSCNKDDFDFEEAQREQARRDSIENARVEKLIEDQAPQLATYVEQHMQGATYIDSLGIYFKVLQPGQSGSYTYSFNQTGGITAPQVTVKYTGRLLNENNTVFAQTEEGKTDNFNLSNRPVIWHWAFLPQTISYDGRDIKVSGLTVSGLQKGSKIQVVTSSPWGYDARKDVKDKESGTAIPENSPLYYEIEVIDIK